jgi:arylsulfatase A-like enzyme
MPRRAREALFLLILAALLASCAPRRPNVVVLLTDDQRHDSLDAMPSVQRLAAEGVRFRQALVTTPVCGASRASLLSGKLPSTLGLHVNEGAAAAFDPTLSIAQALQSQGYTTALYGKYLNGYAEIFPTVPPGWNEWRVFRDAFGDLFGPGSIHTDPVLSWDGSLRRAPGYSTDLLADYAVDFIQRRAPEPAPFFLLLAFSAPHIPLLPADRHLGASGGEAPQPPPSLDEQDLSDKPEWFQAIAADAATRQMLWQTGMPATQEMLLSVDEAVGRVLDALDAQGVAEDTLVIFTSDNGFLFGEHGGFGKGVPYEESIRVPFVARYPALTRHPHGSDALVTQLDVAPTLAALAGVPFESDGHSLVPQLVSRIFQGPPVVPLEFEASMGLTQGYRGFRFRDFKWVVWDDGRMESYDLRRDPYELNGRAPRLRAAKRGRV